MITLRDWLDGVKYNVTDRWDYQRKCFGSNAAVIESEWGCKDGRTYTVTYDRTSLKVFMVCSYSNSDCTGMRWFNPKYRAAYLAEEKRLGMTDITHFTEVNSPRGWSWLTKLIGL